jgi:tetratricopeptide (TPR) repeat protein
MTPQPSAAQTVVARASRLIIAGAGGRLISMTVAAHRVPGLAACALLLALVAAGCRAPRETRLEETGPEPPGMSVGVESYPLSRSERALAAYAAGMEAELAAMPRTALECYRLARELDPAEAEYHGRLGIVLAAGGEREEAGRHLARAVELGSRSFAVLQSLADYYLKKRRNDLAAQQFERMLTCPELSRPGAVRAGSVLRLAFFLTRHYSIAGRPGDAARVAGFLVKRFPRRAEFRLERAKYLLAAGSEATALEEVAEFQKMLPGSSAAERMMALHYSDRKLYGEAMKYVARAMAKVRADPGASAGEVTRLRYFRADLLGKLKRFDDARKELQDLLAGAGDDGEKVDALVALAYLDRSQGKPAEAALRMQGALSSGIRSGRLYGTMAKAFEDLDRFADAVNAYRLAQQLSPRDTGYRLSLARILERQGRRPQAAAEVRAALRVSPGDPACSHYLGHLYALEGINLEEAAQLIAVARRADGRNVRYLESEGLLLYRRGLVERARKLLELAALRGGGAEAYERLGDAYFALGLWHRADYAWKKALELDPRREGSRRKLDRIRRLRRR